MARGGSGTRSPPKKVAPYLESDGQRLVAPPVGRQHGAQEVGAVGAHQFAGVIRQHVHDGAHLGPRPTARGGGPQRPAVLSHLTAGERRGGGCEAPAGARIYGNTHHNGGRQGAAAAAGGSEESGGARREQPGPVPVDPRSRRGGAGGCSFPAPGSACGGLAAVPPAPSGERQHGAPAEPRRGRAVGCSPPPGGPDSNSQCRRAARHRIYCRPRWGGGPAVSDGESHQWRAVPLPPPPGSREAEGCGQCRKGRCLP